MKLRVLGCSGGIGGNLRTTSFLLDHDVLIDAGTGVSELSLAELSVIDHIFVTHSHLDHIACIPLLVDSVWMMRDRPITIYAIEETLEILKQRKGIGGDFQASVSQFARGGVGQIQARGGGVHYPSQAG